MSLGVIIKPIIGPFEAGGAGKLKPGKEMKKALGLGI